MRDLYCWSRWYAMRNNPHQEGSLPQFTNCREVVLPAIHELRQFCPALLLSDVGRIVLPEVAAPRTLMRKTV